MNGFPWLTVITLVPLVGGVVVLGSSGRNLARFAAFGFSLLALALALMLWGKFDSGSADLQFQERSEERRVGKQCRSRW